MNNNPHYPGAGPAANFHQPMPAAQGNQYGIPHYGYHHPMGLMNNNIGYNVPQNMYPPHHPGQYPGMMNQYAQPHTINYSVNAPSVEGQMGRHAMNDGMSLRMGNSRQNHVEEHGHGQNVPSFNHETGMGQPHIRQNEWGYPVQHMPPVAHQRMVEHQPNIQDVQHRPTFNGPGMQQFHQQEHMNGYGQQTHPSQHHQHPPVSGNEWPVNQPNVWNGAQPNLTIDPPKTAQQMPPAHVNVSPNSNSSFHQSPPVAFSTRDGNQPNLPVDPPKTAQPMPPAHVNVSPNSNSSFHQSPPVAFSTRDGNQPNLPVDPPKTAQPMPPAHVNVSPNSNSSSQQSPPEKEVQSTPKTVAQCIMDFETVMSNVEAKHADSDKAEAEAAAKAAAEKAAAKAAAEAAAKEAARIEQEHNDQKSAFAKMLVSKSAMEMHQQCPPMLIQRTQPMNPAHPNFMNVHSQSVQLPGTVPQPDPPAKQTRGRKPKDPSETTSATAKKRVTPRKNKENPVPAPQTPAVQNVPPQFGRQMYGSHPQYPMPPHFLPGPSMMHPMYAQPGYPQMNPMQHYPTEPNWLQTPFSDPVMNYPLPGASMNSFNNAGTYSPESLPGENLVPSIGNLPPIDQLNTVMPNTLMPQPTTAQPNLVSPSNMLTPSTSNSGSMPTSMEQVQHGHTPVPCEGHATAQPLLDPSTNALLDDAVEYIKRDSGPTRESRNNGSFGSSDNCNQLAIPNNDATSSHPSRSSTALSNHGQVQKAIDLITLDSDEDDMVPNTSQSEPVNRQMINAAATQPALETLNQVMEPLLQPFDFEARDGMFTPLNAACNEIHQPVEQPGFSEASFFSSSPEKFPIETFMPTETSVSESADRYEEPRDDMCPLNEFFPDLQLDNQMASQCNQSSVSMEENAFENATSLHDTTTEDSNVTAEIDAFIANQLATANLDSEELFCNNTAESSFPVDEHIASQSETIPDQCQYPLLEKSDSEKGGAEMCIKNQNLDVPTTSHNLVEEEVQDDMLDFVFSDDFDELLVGLEEDRVAEIPATNDDSTNTDDNRDDELVKERQTGDCTKEPETNVESNEDVGDALEPVVSDIIADNGKVISEIAPVEDGLETVPVENITETVHLEDVSEIVSVEEVLETDPTEEANKESTPVGTTTPVMHVDEPTIDSPSNHELNIEEHPSSSENKVHVKEDGVAEKLVNAEADSVKLAQNEMPKNVTLAESADTNTARVKHEEPKKSNVRVVQEKPKPAVPRQSFLPVFPDPPIRTANVPTFSPSLMALKESLAKYQSKCSDNWHLTSITKAVPEAPVVVMHQKTEEQLYIETKLELSESLPPGHVMYSPTMVYPEDFPPFNVIRVAGCYKPPTVRQALSPAGEPRDPRLPNDSPLSPEANQRVSKDGAVLIPLVALMDTSPPNSPSTLKHEIKLDSELLEVVPSEESQADEKDPHIISPNSIPNIPLPPAPESQNTGLSDEHLTDDFMKDEVKDSKELLRNEPRLETMERPVSLESATETAGSPVTDHTEMPNNVDFNDGLILEDISDSDADESSDSSESDDSSENESTTTEMSAESEIEDDLENGDDMDEEQSVEHELEEQYVESIVSTKPTDVVEEIQEEVQPIQTVSNVVNDDPTTEDATTDVSTPVSQLLDQIPLPEEPYPMELPNENCPVEESKVVSEERTESNVMSKVTAKQESTEEMINHDAEVADNTVLAPEMNEQTSSVDENSDAPEEQSFEIVDYQVDDVDKVVVVSRDDLCEATTQLDDVIKEDTIVLEGDSRESTPELTETDDIGSCEPALSPIVEDAREALSVDSVIQTNQKDDSENSHTSNEFESLSAHLEDESNVCKVIDALETCLLNDIPLPEEPLTEAEDAPISNSDETTATVETEEEFSESAESSLNVSNDSEFIETAADCDVSKPPTPEVVVEQGPIEKDEVNSTAEEIESDEPSEESLAPCDLELPMDGNSVVAADTKDETDDNHSDANILEEVANVVIYEKETAVVLVMDEEDEVREAEQCTMDNTVAVVENAVKENQNTNDTFAALSPINICTSDVNSISKIEMNLEPVEVITDEVKATMEAVIAAICEKEEAKRLENDVLPKIVAVCDIVEKCEATIEDQKEDLKSSEVPKVDFSESLSEYKSRRIPDRIEKTVSSEEPHAYSRNDLFHAFESAIQNLSEQPITPKALGKQMKKEALEFTAKQFERMKKNCCPVSFDDEIEDTVEFMLCVVEQQEEREKLFKESCEKAKVRQKYDPEAERLKKNVLVREAKLRKDREAAKKANEAYKIYKTIADNEVADMRMSEELGFSPMHVFDNFMSCTLFFSTFASRMIPRLFETVGARPSYVTDFNIKRVIPKARANSKHPTVIIKVGTSEECLERYEQQSEKNPEDANLFAHEEDEQCIQLSKKPLLNQEVNEFCKVLTKDFHISSFRGCLKAKKMTSVQQLYLFVALLTAGNTEKGFPHSDTALLIFECAFHLCRLGAFGEMRGMIERLRRAKVILDSVQPSAASKACVEVYSTIRMGLTTIVRSISLPVLKCMFIQITDHPVFCGKQLELKKDSVVVANTDRMLSERVKMMYKSGKTSTDFDYYDEYEDLRADVNVPLHLAHYFCRDRTEYIPAVYPFMSRRSNSWIMTYQLGIVRATLWRKFLEMAKAENLTAKEFGETTQNLKYALIYEDYLFSKSESQKQSKRQRDKLREMKNKLVGEVAVERWENNEEPTPKLTPTKRVPGRKRGRPAAKPAPAVEIVDQIVEDDEPAPKRRARQPTCRPTTQTVDPVYEIESEVATSSRGRTRNVTKTWTLSKTKRSVPEPAIPVVVEEPVPQPARRGRKRKLPVEEVVAGAPKEPEQATTERKRRGRVGRPPAKKEAPVIQEEPSNCSEPPAEKEAPAIQEEPSNSPEPPAKKEVPAIQEEPSNSPEPPSETETITASEPSTEEVMAEEETAEEETAEEETAEEEMTPTPEPPTEEETTVASPKKPAVGRKKAGRRKKGSTCWVRRKARKPRPVILELDDDEDDVEDLNCTDGPIQPPVTDEQLSRPKLPHVESFLIYKMSKKEDHKDTDIITVPDRIYYAFEYVPNLFYFFRIAITTGTKYMRRFAAYIDCDFSRPVPRKSLAPKIPYLEFTEFVELMGQTEHPYTGRVKDLYVRVREHMRENKLPLPDYALPDYEIPAHTLRRMEREAAAAAAAEAAAAAAAAAADSAETAATAESAATAAEQFEADISDQERQLTSLAQMDAAPSEPKRRRGRKAGSKMHFPDSSGNCVIIPPRGESSSQH